jgi:transposase
MNMPAKAPAQLVFLNECARTECGVPVDSGHLSDVFGRTRERVRKVLSKRRLGRKAPHRSLSLTDEQEQIACDFMQEESHTGNYVTQRELLNFLEERFRVTLTHGWIQKFLSGHSASVTKAIVSPQEPPRLQTPRCY